MVLTRFSLAAGILLLVAGCGAPVAQFRSNAVYRLRAEKNASDQKLTSQQMSDIRDALAALFGTPDDPHAPLVDEPDLPPVLNEGHLRLAAGPVASDKSGRATGLYREHCVHCHGITGDGQGPTAAALNPYPRDFRRGTFKFKSTPLDSKPTHDDLVKIVRDGIPGTAMPSFRLLDEGEIDALVNYVKYLSIRGEVERKQYDRLDQLDKEDRILDLSLKQSNPEKFNEDLESIKTTVSEVMAKWREAPEQVTPIPPRPEGWNDPEALAASVRRGRELFYTTGACSKCHGDSALGDGELGKFDVWTDEIEPTKPHLLKEYLAAGAFPPRNLRPRNLRLGTYRGGRRPVDLYWRIHNGIAGTTMPKAAVAPEGTPADAKTLAPEEVWALVDYVRALPHESISLPPARKAENVREHF